MEKYSTKETDLAAVAVKNHFHASLNSNAHFPFQITIEQVMKSPLIASPLKLLDCSPISDGAAALIISSKLNKRGRNVFIKASKTATDSLGLAERESLLSLKSTVEASKFAYKQAGVSPQNIDVAEVHDCFTIAEILAMEDLGFYVKGEAVIRINKGETRLGGKGPIVNTSGGLKACGHPVGATGVKQLVEIYQQLKGTAGKKQVEKAKVGLTHNVGGSGGTAVVHILQN
jgi:acetyl-CoA C-acetyltransferase